MSAATDTNIRVCAKCGAKNRVPAARGADHPQCGRCHAPPVGGRGRRTPWP